MYLVDGYRSIITFAAAPGIFLRERELTPMALEQGGPIDTTTMRNGTGGPSAMTNAGGFPLAGAASGGGVRTQAPKSLTSLKDTVGHAQYDPMVYNQIVAIMGLVQIITVTFPDGTTHPFSGWLESFAPSSLKEGDFPLAEFKIWPATGRAGSIPPSSLGNPQPANDGFPVAANVATPAFIGVVAR